MVEVITFLKRCPKCGDHMLPTQRTQGCFIARWVECRNASCPGISDGMPVTFGYTAIDLPFTPRSTAWTI